MPELRLTEHEIFLDAGSFDGSSTTDFINSVNGNYDKIYAFEPMTDGFILTKNALDNISNVEICKAALCNQVGEGNFTKSYEGLMGGSIGNKGLYTETVRLETIDHYLSGNKCTFIKMDIEGAELDALKGAEKTIEQFRPKLAISLYHKREDLYEIPIWIKSIMPNYKMYLRHYANKQWDLVLYCV